MRDVIEQCVDRLVREYAQSVPEGPLDRGLSLRGELAIESLSLLSLVLRLGGELDVDLVDSGVELGQLNTIGDLVGVLSTLVQQASNRRSA